MVAHYEDRIKAVIQDARGRRGRYYLYPVKLFGGEKRFSVKLRAAYEGRFVLPEISCQAMYEPSVAANTASGTAEVVR